MLLRNKLFSTRVVLSLEVCSKNYNSRILGKLNFLFRTTSTKISEPNQQKCSLYHFQTIIGRSCIWSRWLKRCRRMASRSVAIVTTLVATRLSTWFRKCRRNFSNQSHFGVLTSHHQTIASCCCCNLQELHFWNKIMTFKDHI